MWNERWPSVIVRTFGIISLVLAAIGFWAMSDAVIAASTGRLGNSPEKPYLLQAFWTMTIINVVFLALLIFNGIKLIKLRPNAVKLCTVLLVSEILYFFSIPWSTGGNPALGHSIAAASGIGNMGLSVQLVTAYPIIALVVLNLCQRRLKSPVHTV